MRSRRLVLHAFALLVVLACTATARAEGFDASDTLAAIDQAASSTGISSAWLYATVRCETAGTFSPYSVGRQGELGVAQLHPRGELPRFYARGFSDPFNPYESVAFMAERFSEGGASAWSCS